VLATIAGALVADLVWYGLGRWRGPQALALLGRLSRRWAACVGNAEERFLTHQLGFLFSSRFIPEMNPIAAGMAGATGILIATTSALAWALAWMSAGYTLGHVTGRMPTAFGFVTTLGLLAGAILAGWLVLRHRRRVAS
jgi:membrane protein DedA with SNARE-associated domain